MIDLTKFGGRYIPLVPNGKIPAMKFKDRTFDSITLRTHLANGGNFGLLAQPDFVFLDIDMSHGDDGMTNFINWLVENDLDPKEIIDGTLTAETASGGYHLVYLQDPENRFKQDIGFLEGVDIKASPNNFIVVYPSKINGKAYRWVRQVDPIPIPSKLVDAMHKKANEKKRQERIAIADGESAVVDGLRYSRKFNKYPQIDVFYTIENGWGETGTRNRNIFKWAQAMRRIVDDESVAQHYAEIANDNSDEPVDLDEVQNTVSSAYAFVAGLEMYKSDNYEFVKLLPKSGETDQSVVVTPERYDEVKSLYPEDYNESDLYDFRMSMQFVKGINTVKKFVEANRPKTTDDKQAEPDERGLPF